MDAHTLGWIASLRQKGSGLLLRSQLTAAGVSTGRIRRWVVSGSLLEIAPTVYALPGAALNDETRLVATAHSVGGVVDGEAALWLLGVVATTPTRLDVCLPATSNVRARVSGVLVVLHRPVVVAGHQAVDLNGLRVATVERALCRVATYARPIELLTLARAAVRLGKTTVDSLAGFLLSHRRLAGRPALARAVASLDNFGSVFERHFGNFLNSRSITGWVREHKIRASGRTFYLDFAWPNLRVAIELDGKAFHSTDEQFETDRARQNLIVLGGWTILRFTWAQLVENPDRIAREITRAISPRIVQKRAISA